MVGVINISWGNGRCQSWIAGKVLWRIQFKMFNPDAMCTEKGCRIGLWMYPTAQDEQHLFPQPGSSRWQLLWTCLRIVSHCVLHSGPDLKSVETFQSGPYVFKDLRSLWWTPINAYGTVWFMGCTASDFPVHWRVNEVEVCPFFFCIPPDRNVLSQEAPPCCAWSEKSGEAPKAGKASEAVTTHLDTASSTECLERAASLAVPFGVPCWIPDCVSSGGRMPLRQGGFSAMALKQRSL